MPSSTEHPQSACSTGRSRDKPLMPKMIVERNAAELPEAKRIFYRIGVNLGEVLIEGDELGGAFAMVLIASSASLISSSRRSSCRTSGARAARTTGGKSASSAAINLARSRAFLGPCGAMTPISAKCPCNAFRTCVRCATSISRGSC
jgi:hypothetical protein